MKVCNGTYELVAEMLDQASTEPIYLSTKSEIVGYYQQEYGATWRLRLTTDIQSFEPNTPRSTIRRRFSGGRENRNTERGKADEYAQLGQQLPPTMVPRKDLAGRKLKIEVKGDVKISKDKRKRSFSATLDARQQRELRQGDLGAIFEAYGMNPGAIEEFCPDSNGIQISYQ